MSEPFAPPEAMASLAWEHTAAGRAEKARGQQNDPLQVARVALSKASLVDPRVRHADPAVLAQWAELLVGITADEVMAAVLAYYRDPRERTILPGDIRAHALAHRRGANPLAVALGDTRAIAARPGDPKRIAAARGHIRKLLADMRPRILARRNPSPPKGTTE